MKKIEELVSILNAKSNILKCPVCGETMRILDGKSVVCLNNHCFDLSKHGYINLLKKAIKADYCKELFESRNLICKNGFYDVMLEEIISIIISKLKEFQLNDLSILDAGCGEGSHINYIVSRVKEEISTDIFGVGIDISKEGIQVASKEYDNLLWCVTDIADMPFKDNSFDLILNILSPSNNSEFERVLKDSGIVLKVVPGSNYLKELRNIFFDSTDKEEYSNEKVVLNFEASFDVIEKKEVKYSVKLDCEYLKHLIKMTPLSWNVDEEKIKKAYDIKDLEITVDLLIMVGSKK